MESLGHGKAYHGVNYFSGYGVVIIRMRMLRVSQEICLVVKEFGETFTSVKLSFLILVKTIEAKRVLLWLILMSNLTDRNDV